ncbi:cell division protein ZapE [Ehrlichia ruminantium]|uniref:Cell division protein ZapE n=1 Tax=Ehrlichia ruminantium TaxID=779 RepID=A0AAE6QAF3_EHRRU|nr:cell division protein ZapE [Ehrlichia ruminantium]QGR02679.1 cell division protein ZapE [Ehrlichia ruminantium]QGR03600.1 cell division protein ZapE [Ehrlichia ruminantium]QGR04527.1 cell division protein ZapE [Ehrlichia ruminantium]
MNRKIGEVFATYYSMVDSGKITYDEQQVKLLEQFLPYLTIQNICSVLPIKKKLKKVGIYIYGKVGRGKSMVTDLYYSTCKIENKKRQHFNQFMKEIHCLLHEFRSSCIKDPLYKVAKTMCHNIDLLFLDEIQVYDICDAMILYRLFSIIFDQKIIVMMTSNYAPVELYQDGIQRKSFEPAISLIMDRMHVIHLSGKQDYRTIKGLGIKDVYFIGDHSYHRLSNLFVSMVDNREVRPMTLCVLGRNIKVNRVCGNIAWFDFHELCGQPLWVSDYQEIVRNFSVIFIAGIPIFDFYNRNEMSRFTILVDELYENKTKIFCSLAAEPQSLYYSCDIPVDFQRTISRLIEMRSKSYSDNAG